MPLGLPAPAPRLGFAAMTDLAILYEHPLWFEPLFRALERRGVSYEAISLLDHVFDPAESSPAPVVFNRLAMSSFMRQAEHAVFYAQALYDHWERGGAAVVNGAATLAIDASKARQLSLIHSLGLKAPATRVVHTRADLSKASEGLRFPIVVKADIGGAGAGIVRYDDPAALAEAAAAGTTPTGVNGVTLVQEYVPVRDGRIVRAETLDGRLLYALAVTTDGATFDLCPADACQGDKPAISMAETTLDANQTRAVEAIARAARLDVGGIEFMVDDRDGATLFYDVNALSNFVADPMSVLGYDPHERLVDYLQARVAAHRKAAA